MAKEQLEIYKNQNRTKVNTAKRDKNKSKTTEINSNPVIEAQYNI